MLPAAWLAKYSLSLKVGLAVTKHCLSLLTDFIIIAKYCRTLISGLIIKYCLTLNGWSSIINLTKAIYNTLFAHCNIIIG